MMSVLFGFNFGLFLLGFAIVIVSLFLILIVLVQRGRGGGLTGALGGMGGQSAFGTKAGDVFTRITIGTSVVWFLLCIVTIKVYSQPSSVESTESSIGGSGTEDESPLKLDVEKLLKEKEKNSSEPNK